MIYCSPGIVATSIKKRGRGSTLVFPSLPPSLPLSLRHPTRGSRTSSKYNAACLEGRPSGRIQSSSRPETTLSLGLSFESVMLQNWVVFCGEIMNQTEIKSLNMKTSSVNMAIECRPSFRDITITRAKIYGAILPLSPTLSLSGLSLRKI